MKTNFIVEEYNTVNIKVENFIQQYGTVFHQFNFLTAVGDNYVCYVIKDILTENIKGVLPLVKTVKFGLKSYHIPPYAYQFGPVVCANSIKQKEHFLSILLKKVKNNSQIDFKSKIENGDIIPFKHVNYSIEALQTHIFSSGKLFDLSVISSDKRRDIKKLLKLHDQGEIRIIENDETALDHVLFLWDKTAKRAKFNPHSKRLKNIINSKIKYYCNSIVDSKGNPLAATYCPYDKNTMFHLIGASGMVEDKLLARANILSLYNAILFANKNKLDFDFEGSNISGVANFYRSMGGDPVIIHRIQKTRSLFYNLLKGLKNIIK